jgi:hypothetical protein
MLVKTIMSFVMKLEGPSMVHRTVVGPAGKPE